jgi:hypothetical protein
LAFATTAVDAPHRIETPAPLLYRGIPVRAVRAVRADPKVDLHVPDSSLGVHRSPLRRHDRPASTSRPGRRLGFAPGLPRPGCAPFLPFLPASTVSSAAAGSEDPTVRRFAGLLHPATGHGVHHVSDSLAQPLGRAATRRSETRRSGESSPVAKTLRSVPLLGSLAMPSPRRVLPDSVAFTDWRAFSPFQPYPLPCRHGAPSCSSTSRLSSTEESVALRATLPLRARSMLPWALDRSRSRCCRANRAAPSFEGRFASRPSRFGVPRPERREKAMEFRPCLAPCVT